MAQSAPKRTGHVGRLAMNRIGGSPTPAKGGLKIRAVYRKRLKGIRQARRDHGIMFIGHDQIEADYCLA